MTPDQLKSHLQNKKPIAPKRDVTPELISIAENRLIEIEQKVAKITERIMGAKYEYFHNRMQREKADLMEAYQFNVELLKRLKGTDDVR